MLAIRLQRVGRKGHAQFRLIVQDSRFSPKSGRVVAYIGSYNPHTKTATLDSQKATSYLEKGAQPSGRVASLLKQEGVKLPSWVKSTTKKQRSIRNPEKLRRNRPAEEPSSKQEVQKVDEEVQTPTDQPAAQQEPTEEASSSETAGPKEDKKSTEEVSPAPAAPEKDESSEPAKKA